MRCNRCLLCCIFFSFVYISPSGRADRKTDSCADLATARRLLGKDAIIGVTASSAEEALQAANAGADYLGIGTVFATPTSVNLFRSNPLPNQNSLFPITCI